MTRKLTLKTGTAICAAALVDTFQQFIIEQS